MDFFNSCKDKEEAKKVYRNLCKHFHPDKGGDPELMKELQQQYEKFTPRNETEEFVDNLFHASRFYGSNPGFEFNKIRRGNFDNPLYGEIRNLENKITELQRQLRVTDNRLNVEKNNLIVKEKYYEGIVKNLKKENEELYQEYDEEASKVEQLNLEILRLKSTDFEKMTVFEFMKYKWSKKDEKQS